MTEQDNSRVTDVFMQLFSQMFKYQAEDGTELAGIQEVESILSNDATREQRIRGLMFFAAERILGAERFEFSGRMMDADAVVEAMLTERRFLIRGYPEQWLQSVVTFVRSSRYSFEDGVKAFEYAAKPRPESVKVVIEMG